MKIEIQNVEVFSIFLNAIVEDFKNLLIEHQRLYASDLKITKRNLLFSLSYILKVLPSL